MFEKASIMNIFPVPVWAHALKTEDAEAVNRGALAAIERLKAQASDLPAGAPWQSSGDLHREPEIEALTAFIRGAAQSVLHNLDARVDDIEIASCWADVTPQGTVPEGRSDYAEAALAGIYCVRSGETGGLVFHDPKPKPEGAGLVYAKPNRYNSRNATVAAVGGTLVVFPAWLGHSFAPNEADEDRVTVGFHIAIRPTGGA